MPKQSIIDQLDDAIGTAMSNPGKRTRRLDPAVAALLRIAGELRDLPRAAFKTRLKAEFAPARGSRARTVTRTARRARIASVPRKAPAPLLHPSAIPCLVIKGAARAIEFYQRTFGALELSRHEDPGSGKIWHAEIQVGNTPIALVDEEGDYNRSPQSLGGSPVIVGLDVDDPDAVVERAVAGGARVIFPVADQFYGQRGGRIADPFGHIWIVSKTIESVPPDEMRRRSEAYAKEHAAETHREEAPAMNVKPAPEGYHSITPYLQVDGAARLIDFLKRAFGAEELLRVKRDDGKIAHAQMRVSGSMIELADAPPQPTAIWLFVDDVDATYRQALAAGAKSGHEPWDEDYGNREASVRDPFGNHWYIATPLPGAEWPEELRSVTPYLHPMKAAPVIDFMKKAFDADVLARHEGGGAVLHAQVRIGDSVIAMGDAHGESQPMPPALHLYVPDADAVYNRALRAGARTLYAPYDAPYGERTSGVTDPFGNVWYIATHQRDVPAAELESRAPEEPQPARRPGHIMPFVYVEDALKEAEFCKRVFGASETHRVTEPNGKVSHLQLAIDDTRIMLRDANTADLAEYRAKGLAATPHSLGASPLHLYIYVPDADAAFKRALNLGSKITDPIGDKDWGDRCGGVQDPEGHIWYIATPLKGAR